MQFDKIAGVYYWNFEKPFYTMVVVISEAYNLRVNSGSIEKL